jgi:transcription elongation factor GreA
MAMQRQDVPLTRGAIDELTKELKYLRTIKRREVANQMRDALDAELSLDSEAAVALEPAKESQAFVEGRIAAIEDLLGHATVIDEEAARRSTVVQLGSVVVVEQNGGNTEHRYQIVGTAESDPAGGKLSCKSPVGAALLGHRVGDEVEVQVPAGVQRYRIKRLGYASSR